jgi:hypothetical protein
MTQAINPSGWPILRGIQTVKEVSYLNMRTASAAAQLAKLWSDTFLTNAGIYAAGSADYTYRGSANFDVVRASTAAEKVSNTGEDTIAYINGATIKFGQSFTPANDYAITQVIAKCRKGGAPTGNINCQIFATDANGKPTGGELAHSDNTVDSSTFDLVTYAEITFNFSGANSINLTAGVKYAFVLSAAGAQNWGGPNYIEFRVASAGGYTGGNRLYQDGTNWTVQNDDTYFKISGAASRASVVSVLALDLAADVTNIMMFADVTLGTGTATYYASTDDGVTWTAVTPETLAAVPAGKKIRIKVTFTGTAELESWGVAV